MHEIEFEVHLPLEGEMTNRTHRITVYETVSAPGFLNAARKQIKDYLRNHFKDASRAKVYTFRSSLGEHPYIPTANVGRVVSHG